MIGKKNSYKATHLTINLIICYCLGIRIYDFFGKFFFHIFANYFTFQMLNIERFFYKPNFNRILIDIIAWVLTLSVVLIWRFSTEKFTILNYIYAFLTVLGYWFVLSYCFQRYRVQYRYRFLKELLVVLIVAAVVYVSFYLGADRMSIFKNTSIYVINLMIVIMFIVSYLIILVYQFYRYATSMDEELPQVEPRQWAAVRKAPKEIEPDELEDIRNEIRIYTDQESLDFIEKHINLKSTNTRLFASTTKFNFNTIRQYRYDALVNLAKLNSIRGINIIFNKVNEKLPDDGLWCICYESIEQLRENINRKYPPLIRQMVQGMAFLTKRILPKIALTSRLYFDITKGKNRYFSHTEILGRLYYCGFEVVSECTTSNLNWVVARRKTNPQRLVHKRYGIIIKLPRVCKNGDIRPIYKMRTMYPYAEYIQSYMYQKSGTDDIGKIKNDMRVTGWGRIFRKFWIDELPMIWNLMKGDLKIVGVRPISMANFNTYPQYLQEKRTKVKPGLIPPMYCDMPKSDREFYDSEERYIDKYLQAPIKTDIQYFFKALYNIFIKRARSH